MSAEYIFLISGHFGFRIVSVVVSGGGGCGGAVWCGSCSGIVRMGGSNSLTPVPTDDYLDHVNHLAKDNFYWVF